MAGIRINPADDHTRILALNFFGLLLFAGTILIAVGLLYVVTIPTGRLASGLLGSGDKSDGPRFTWSRHRVAALAIVLAVGTSTAHYSSLPESVPLGLPVAACGFGLLLHRLHFSRFGSRLLQLTVFVTLIGTGLVAIRKHESLATYEYYLHELAKPVDSTAVKNLAQVATVCQEAPSPQALRLCPERNYLADDYLAANYGRPILGCNAPRKLTLEVIGAFVENNRRTNVGTHYAYQFASISPEAPPHGSS